MRLPRWFFAPVLLLPLLAPAAARAATTPPSFSTTTLPGAGGEPNVSVSPSGKTVLVSGLGNDSPATLYRSTDYGRHFTQLHPTFPQTGGGDWDMRWLDEHTVIAADLSIGQGFFVDRSTDGGLTWTSAQVLQDQYDRPWLDHFGPDQVYAVAKGFDGVPYLYRSSDGGRSFGTPPVPVFIYGTPTTSGGPAPTDAFVTNQNAYVDHLTVDQRTGDVYVLFGIDQPSTYRAAQPAGAANQLYVGRLAGDHFVVHPVHLGGPDESFLAGFNWMTVDRAGTLYALANGRIGGRWSARLSYSKDHGTTWSRLVDVGPAGAANVYGAVAGAAAGRLSLVYLRGSSTDPTKAQNWYVETAGIAFADTGAPRVQRSRPVAAAVHTQDICFDGLFCGLPGFGNDRSLLDYIWTAVDSQGHAYSVIASDGPATGGKPVSVMVIRQNGGGLYLGPGVAS
ncbi:MAG: Photosynthesis system assembly factor [Acidimicrobiaceae bacterium]|nr:Photosynthesis system assembly factor [Acidimicrobiaceae bacterium]